MRRKKATTRRERMMRRRASVGHVISVPVRNASQKQPGNWVLITTRFGNLAQQMGASFYQYRVSSLNEEDAWALLKIQLPPSPNNQVVGIDDLRDVGMKIVRKCDGLPLAVKVMGGLLSTRPQSELEWEAVLNHHAWSVDGLPKELDSRIYLSYEDLSPQLKQCFLYCSLFPKNALIWKNYIVPMWISEGFVQSRDGSSSTMHDDQLEEIAAEYYEELVTRNLIEPAKQTITSYSSTMHDVVRSFAEFMAREESVVLQDSKQVSSNGTRLVVRRMSVGPSEVVPKWTALQKQESLRTLAIFWEINFERGDSLACFSRLRVLCICGGNCDRLVIGSLCQLRHLRYFYLESTNVSRLPEDIHRMKFLQHIGLVKSRNLESLPMNIIKLAHLKTLNMYSSNTDVVIPKGFGGLTSLRSLYGFPVHMDMDGGRYCSLEEIGPLFQLRKLTLHGLENVPASSWAEMARISSKEHLDFLELHWSGPSGGMELRDEIEKQHAAEEVLEKLWPPPSIQHLEIQGYFGLMLPNWMMVPAATGAFKSLMFLRLEDLPCCTKLPDGLCRLPCLKGLEIKDAPAIRSVGPEFQASSSCSAAVVGGGVTAATPPAFPNLTLLRMEGLREWEEWDWEEQVVDGNTAMPALEDLSIGNCKLSCLPPGLASSKRHALRALNLYLLANLTSVENLPSVVELHVLACPELKRISGLSRLYKIRIDHCPNVEVLEGVPSLDSLELEDTNMDALPGYLRAVNPRYLQLDCSTKLRESLSPGSSDWNKISHIGKLNIQYIEESDAESQED